MDLIPTTTTPSTTRRSNATSTPNIKSRNSNSSLENESLNEIPPRIVRTLREIYEHYSLALVVIDPTTYNEAKKIKNGKM